MTWQPLVTDGAERERIAAIVRDIVAATDAVATNRLDDFADRALLHAYITGDEDAISAALAAAVEAYQTQPHILSLFSGAARIGWVLAHVTSEDVAADVCVPIERGLERHALVADNYDLIGGLVGFGVFALERGDAGLALATRVLERLEQLARPRGGGIAWHTEPQYLPDYQREVAPNGYWNLGLAHGVPGVIALLARYIARGIEATRARVLLDGAVAYVMAAEPERPSGRYPSWHVDDVVTGLGSVSRVAWCYGDLGVAMALYAAARACDDATLGDRALALAAACIDRTPAAAAIRDGGFCHGGGGAAHCFYRLFRASGDRRFEAAARAWLDRTLAMRNSHPIAGFPAALGDPPEWEVDASLLTGAPGVALVLSGLISDVEPSWDRLLLVDI